MPRRTILTDRQKTALFRLPVEQADLLRHYTLSDEDLEHIRHRRRAHNKFGFALQLCVLRYPGRILAPGEVIPLEIAEFIGAQLGLNGDDLLDYAVREETRHEHLAELRQIYGFRSFTGREAGDLKEWIYKEAEHAVSNEDLVHRFGDLPSKRLYAFDPASAPANLRPLIGGKLNEPLIERNWPDILRVAATMTAGIMPPSQILRKLASYPRQNEVAVALREVGRIERTLFMINWIMDIGMQRRARVGLNKGESHHALKQAVNFYRRGEIRDRSTEGQHYRVAGLNLLTTIIIFWNTLKLGDAVKSRDNAGLPIPPELLAHVSPLGWEHINLIGEYRWPTA